MNGISFLGSFIYLLCKYISFVKLTFSTHFLSIFSTINAHTLLKFPKKCSEKLLFFSNKANYVRNLILSLHFFTSTCTGSQIDNNVCIAENGLRFDQAYQDVIANALEIKALQAQCSARQAEWWQAGALPNPDLAISLENIGPSDYYDNNELSVYLNQLVELGGKRNARLRVAEAEQESICWDIEIRRGELFSEFLHAFIDVAVAQERIKLAKIQHQIADENLQCTKSKSTNGKSSLLEIKKSEIACKSANLNLSKQKSALTQTKKKLITFWDCEPPKFEIVSFPLFEINPPQAFQELMAMLVETPIYCKAKAELNKSKEIYALERSNSIPDIAIQIGISSERFYREPSLNFGIDIPLPIFDQNHGNICKASHESWEAFYSQNNTLCHLKSELSAIFDGWSNAYEVAITLRDSILPSANENFILAKESLETGKFDYLSFLDAKTTLFNVQQDYLDAVEEYHHKRAEALGLTFRSSSTLMK